MYSNQRHPSNPAWAFSIAAAVFSFIAAFPVTGNALDMSLPATLCAQVLASPQYSIESVTVLRTLAPGRIPLWPVWSQDAKRVGFTAVDPTLMDGYSWLSEIWVMDVATSPAATRLLTEADGATCNYLCFTPDDRSLLYGEDIQGEYGSLPGIADAHVPGRETSLGIRATDLDPSIAYGVIFHADMRSTPNGNKMVVDVEKDDGTMGIYLIPTTDSGVPEISAATAIVNDVAGVNPIRLSLSPTGNELLFAYSLNGIKPNIALITGLDRIVSGEAPPINSLTDARVKIMIDGPNHADAPSWSEDGSLFFYGYDFSGAFTMIDMNFDVANFDVMVVRLADALAGNVNPTRLQIPGNQGCINMSRGGTRIVFGQSGTPGYQVCAASFCISDTMNINEAGIVQDPFTIKDGSGTGFRAAQFTVVSGYGTGAGPLKISVFTPTSALDRDVLASGRVAIGAVRIWSYENLAAGGNPNPQPASFDPPVQVEFAYTDAEIQGLHEDELLVYGYNPETGRLDRVLPVIQRDLGANRITIELDTLGPTGAAGKGTGQVPGALALGIVDSDSDGLSDQAEFLWDGDPAANVFDPDTNPTGTDLNPQEADTDGDGIDDSVEVTFGSDPLDANSAVQIPAAGNAALTLQAAMLAVAGLLAQRKKRRAR